MSCTSHKFGNMRKGHDIIHHDVYGITLNENSVYYILTKAAPETVFLIVPSSARIKRNDRLAIRLILYKGLAR